MTQTMNNQSKAVERAAKKAEEEAKAVAAKAEMTAAMMENDEWEVRGGQDPERDQVRVECEKLVGTEIELNATVKLPDGTLYYLPVANCNIVGDMLENLLLPVLQSSIATMAEGPKQASPDFFNKGIFEYELKACRMEACGFDVSNFASYIDQLSKNLERKMNTKYLVFRYSMGDEGLVTLRDFKMLDVWSIVNYSGKYPVSIQNKKGMWHNLRPCQWEQMDDKSKTPSKFIESICEAISKCPNDIPDRDTIIEKIKSQFTELLRRTSGSGSGTKAHLNVGMTAEAVGN
jgi:hypothetical protein